MTWRKTNKPDSPVDWSDYKPGHSIELIDVPITARAQSPKNGDRFPLLWDRNMGQDVLTGGSVDGPALVLQPAHVFLVRNISIRFDDKQAPSPQGRLELILGNRIYGDWPLFIFADTGVDAWHVYILDRPLFIGSQLPVRAFLSGIWPADRWFSFALCGDRGRPLS